LTAPFEADLLAYRDAGADGIGIWELKLPAGEDERSLALVRESGLEVTNCVPHVPSILPLPLIDGPVDPRERIEAICASIRRLAPFEPAGEPALGLTFDVWHLWNGETLHDDIREHADLFVAVQVNDRREPTRGWADRVLPGEGVAGVPAILASLEGAGWTGPYDLEIFSDNGA